MKNETVTCQPNCSFLEGCPVLRWARDIYNLYLIIVKSQSSCNTVQRVKDPRYLWNRVHNEKFSIITVTFWLVPIVKIISKKKKKHHHQYTQKKQKNMKTPTFLKLFLVCRENSRVVFKWLFVFTLPPTVWEILLDASPPAPAVNCISYDVIWTGVRWKFKGL